MTAGASHTPSAFERLSVPGPRHQALAPLMGRWHVEMTTRTAGGAATTSADVTATKEWYGGGRYVREEVSGTFAGKPHNKLTVLGYNAVRRRYEYVTADDHDAAILLYATLPGAEGDGRSITLFADYVYAGDGPEVAGSLVTIRTVIGIDGPDRHTLRNFYAPPGGAEYLFLEYVYTRVSS